MNPNPSTIRLSLASIDSAFFLAALVREGVAFTSEQVGQYLHVTITGC